jgi:hypothetical protein
VWQPVDANEPVVRALTSAENIPKENSIADKQISYLYRTETLLSESHLYP